MCDSREQHQENGEEGGQDGLGVPSPVLFAASRSRGAGHGGGSWEVMRDRPAQPAAARDPVDRWVSIQMWVRPGA